MWRSNIYLHDPADFQNGDRGRRRGLSTNRPEMSSVPVSLPKNAANLKGCGKVLCWLAFSISVGVITEARDITLCDLASHGFEGRLISLRSRLLFTMHGIYLLGDSCVTKGQHSAALLFPGERTAPPVRFDVDPSAISQLRPFFRTTGDQAFACGVLSGQVFYKKGFRLRHDNGISFGNGFGEHGTLEAAFVLQSVKEIHQCD